MTILEQEIARMGTQEVKVETKRPAYRTMPATNVEVEILIAEGWIVVSEHGLMK